MLLTTLLLNSDEETTSTAAETNVVFVAPTLSPTLSPSRTPSASPSAYPTIQPSSKPSVTPSFEPTGEPTASPSETLLVGFTLINANSDLELMPVSNGDEVDLSSLGTRRLNLRADIDTTGAWVVDSVTFSYGSEASRTDSIPPYSLGGESNGDYKKVDWLSTVGIKAVTVSVLLVGGETEETTIQFSMIDGDG